MEDEQIIKWYLERNEKALKEAQNKYGSYCFGIAKNILTVREDAEECVNDIWHLSWNKIPPVIPVSLKAFLGKLVRDTAISQYRANHAKKRYKGMEMLFDELEECIPAGRNANPHAQEILTEAIERFLDSLDQNSRVMLIKRYWYADSVSEIANVFGMRENSVSAKLMRLRRKLKKYLEQEGIRL